MDTTKYPLALPNSPDFFINDNSTQQEQEDTFLNIVNGKQYGTGIVEQAYTGLQQDLGANVKLSNQSPLVDSNATNPRMNPDILPSVALIPGGMGMYDNILLNFPSADGLWRGAPIWDYSPMEIINSLPVYQGSRVRLLDNFNDLIDSDEYDWFCVGLPANDTNATVAWKDTYRTQVSVPPESYLVMICAQDLLAVEHPNGFRFQVFDDGAGEYLIDTPFNSLCMAGNGTSQGLSSNAIGPYMLQSPLAVVAPGLLTISITNVNASNDERENPIEFYLTLIFATPKRCRAETSKLYQNVSNFKERVKRSLVLEA